MQPDTQRRSNRVPLGVLVELTHEDFDESFEADGIDVGVGGLGMRAAFLPDVGSRMTAAFADPEGGQRVEAPCEVVWARDSGAHVGQVGLRFTSLAPGAREAIEGMVARATEDPVPTADRRPVIEPEVQEVVGGDHAAVRLFIDGVDASIPARVVARYEGGVRVVQRLGLFKMGTQVAVQNGARKHGRIEGVAIRSDGDVPELILDLAVESPSPDTEASVLGAAPVAHEPAIPAALDAEADALVGAEGPDTIPDTLSPCVADEGAIDPAMAAAPAEMPAPAAGTPTPPAAVPHGGAEAAAPASTGGAHRLPVTVRVRRMAEGVAPHWRRLRAVLAAAVAAMGPLLARGRTGARAMVAKTRPVARRAWSRSVTRVARFLAVLRERMGWRLPGLARRPKKRRTTAPPPPRSNVAGTRRPAADSVDPRRERARTVMLAIVAFAGAAALVYALSPGSTEEVDTHRPVAEPTSSHAASEEPSGGMAPGAEAGSAEAEAEAQAEADPPAEPQAPGTVPASSPYADPADSAEAAQDEPALANAPELTREFGETSVPEGRSFLLRMSQPVESLRGTAERNGFTVIIPDSLSLDRAGPIAAAHPAVERSMVLNRGDHAELSIRFAEGESPPYRVRGRGRALEITLGR